MLQSITLQNFRTYKKRIIELHPELTVIVGPNAVGKTNILEAIFATAIGKSFRADKEGEVITWGEEVSRIKGTSKEDILELVMTHGLINGGYAPKKKFLVNGVARRQLDFTGRIPAVLFWPEDLSLVINSPSVRREYLNRVLVQVDREYRRSLSQYEKGVRQRNKLLFFIHEGSADRSQLPYWNNLLIQTGQYITKKREEFIGYINSREQTVLHYQLEYDKSTISQERLDQYKEEEIAAKTTLVGPHRDDMIFKFPNKKEVLVDLAKYGSRGEQRMGVLWCKMGELVYIEELTKKKPLLLLDDIFSELDHAHQEEVIVLIHQYQTIMTSADSTILDRFPKKEMSVIELTYE